MPQASRGDLDHSVVSKEQVLQFLQPALGRSTTALSKKYKRTTHKKQTIQKDFHKHCQKERKKKLPSLLDEADRNKRSTKLVQFLENAMRQTIDCGVAGEGGEEIYIRPGLCQIEIV